MLEASWKQMWINLKKKNSNTSQRNFINVRAFLLVPFLVSETVKNHLTSNMNSYQFTAWRRSLLQLSGSVCLGSGMQNKMFIILRIKDRIFIINVAFSKFNCN